MSWSIPEHMEGKGTAAEVGVEGPNPLVLLLHPLPSLPLWVPRRGDRTVSSSGRQLHPAHLRVLAQAVLETTELGLT